jgi:two-component system, OmpR family, sensor histidine kinase SenX3
MTPRPRRIGGTTWLAVAVGLLLPALAWMQYDWVTQLAAADRDRRERTLRTAALQFTAAIDTDLSRIGGSLQLDGAMVERQDWDAYALRYAAATANQSPSLIRGVWYVETERPRRDRDRGRNGDRDRREGRGDRDDRDDRDDRNAPLVLRQWMPEQRTFAEVPWPADLATVRAQLEKQRDDEHGPGGGAREFMAATAALGDERTLVMPIVRLSMFTDRDRPRGRFLSDLHVRSYTVVGLALEELVATRLPAMVEEHFSETGYRVAVVTREGGRVVFESEPGAAAATEAAPDLTASFFQPRVGPMMFFARTAASGRGNERIELPPPPAPPGERQSETVVNVIEMRDGERTMRSRTMSHPPGHWTLRVQHRAGSLEAAVAASRRRNLLLSGGVLALLGVAVALIAVSARRSHALARQQMEFVAAVSHELRTPVAVIHSAAGNLADGVVGDPSRVKRYGATIQTEARRLGETVERVLQLAGLGSGQPLPATPLSAAEVVRDAVQHTSLDAERAGVDVQVEIGADLPPLVGDGPSLQSAVQNLVGNAVKYAGADRWVRVRVSAGRTSSGPEVRIAVEDHGPGLDVDEQRRVFEPFYRGKDAVANQIQGSGLGLSLVRRIVDAHGGRIELESAPGRGSTFTICLPGASSGVGAGALRPSLDPSAPAAASPST